MGIRFSCPNGHKLNVKPILMGKRAICPKCGAKVRVPLESQTATVNSDDSPDGPPAGDGDGAHDRANRYNGDDPRLRETANFGGFGGEDDLSFDDDDDDDLLAFNENPSGRGGLPLPQADPALNDAAFEDDPLTHGALNDAALADPALGVPGPEERARQKRAQSERPATPPPLHGTPRRPPLPASGHGGKGSAGQGLRPIIGAAVERAIGPAGNLQPQSDSAGSDPILRFRLQRERRNRIMMLLTAILVVVVIVLVIVLVMVLPRQDADAPPAEPSPAAADESVGARQPAAAGPIAAAPAVGGFAPGKRTARGRCRHGRVVGRTIECFSTRAHRASHERFTSCIAQASVVCCFWPCWSAWLESASPPRASEPSRWPTASCS